MVKSHSRVKITNINSISNSFTNLKITDIPFLFIYLFTYVYIV